MPLAQAEHTSAATVAPADPYAYLPEALARLEHDGGAEHLLLAVRGYVALGLGDPAGELVERLAARGADPDQLAEVSAAVRGTRSGRLSWEACTGRFRRNLKVLVDRDPSLAAIEEAWATFRPNVELFRTSDGNHQIARILPGGGRCWLPALADHKSTDQARPFHHDEKALVPAPYLFEGLGHGHYFRRVYESTQDTFLGYGCALFVVERDPAALALSLHLHDWQRILADPRVMIFVGEDCLERLVRTLEADDDLSPPAVCVQEGRWSPGLHNSPVEAVERIIAKRQQQARESLARIQAQYADRDAAYWARRFREALDGTGEPLRILSAVSRHTTFLQYSLGDARQAFERAGCRVRVLTEPSDHHGIGDATYHRTVEEFNPDLFFMLDHLRGAHAPRVPDNLPIFTWDQDLLPYAINASTVATMGPLDVVGGISARYCVTTLGLDRRRVISAVMPTNPQRFSAEPLPEAELQHYRCDVSFVSHASQTAEQFHVEQRAALPDEASRGLLDEVYRLVSEIAPSSPYLSARHGKEMLDRARSARKLQITDPFRNWLLSWYSWRLLDRLFRHDTLHWVADWARQQGRTFHIYGRGWDKHATLHPFARGEAHNEHELRCVYQASAINLQLIPSGFLHQRALDGLAAGGFFLVRRSGSDYESVSIRRVLDRVEELGVSTLTDPQALQDDDLQAVIAEHERQTGLRCDPSDQTYLVSLRMSAGHRSPGELFPRFGELLFDDAASFGQVADRFVDDAPLRREIVGQMREVVLDRFTYDRTMQRFLEFMRDHLAQAAGHAGVD
jgi:hypothetical protein